MNSLTPAVFKIAISEGYYQYDGFMCHSLRDMGVDGTISHDAVIEITEVLE